jgi:large subunit ribosomal protein L23
MMDILIRPIVTEKMERLTNKVSQYGFIVEKKANKLQIKRAIEDLYGVTVDSVNTIRYAGKLKTAILRLVI